jgi:hypothetical protein
VTFKKKNILTGKLEMNSVSLVKPQGNRKLARVQNRG